MLTDLTVNEVNNLINYDSITGVFTWKVKPNKKLPVGTVAGSINSHGYRQIQLFGRLYRAGRIAWLLTYGDWPSSFIDHINRDRQDDRIANLRLATHPQNGQNMSAKRSSKTGVKGVHRCSYSKKFYAQIRFNGERHHLGVFDSIEDARKAYESASEQFHSHRPL